MEQFKWQHPATAAGYFRVAPEAVALGQRELYEEVAELYEDVVLDAVVTEYDLWEREVDRGGAEPLLPAGPADASETCSRPCSGRCNESRESKRTIDACGRCSACTRRDFG